MMSTLRYGAEVREMPADLEVSMGTVHEDQVALAVQLINNQTAAYDPGVYADRYQEALLSLIKAKLQGQTPVQVQQAAAENIVDFAAALKESVARTAKSKAGKTPAKSKRKSVAA